VEVDSDEDDEAYKYEKKVNQLNNLLGDSDSGEGSSSQMNRISSHSKEE